MFKIAKFGLCMVVAIGVMAIASSCSGGTKLAECFDEAQVKQSAEEAIGLVHSNDYDAFIDKFEENTKKALTKESFDKQVVDVVESKGKFEKFENEALVGQTDKDTGKNYAGIIVIAKYENGNIQYTLGYDEDMKLIQFLIK